MFTHSLSLSAIYMERFIYYPQITFVGLREYIKHCSTLYKFVGFDFGDTTLTKQKRKQQTQC
jgi:hypothetical protein